MSDPQMELLMDVPVQLTAELGRCSMSIADVLKLGAGSIVELDRLAAGPIDLLINERLVARGEIVALDENFAVRVTQLVQNDEKRERTA